MAASSLAFAKISDSGRCALFAALVVFLLLLEAAELCVLAVLCGVLFFAPHHGEVSKLHKAAMSHHNVLNDVDPNAPRKMDRFVQTSKELDKIFQSMAPYFEDRETEQNWKRRELSVSEIRKLTHGNAPTDFESHFIAGIKLLLDGIIKTVRSLRTTVSTNGCELVQDLANVLGSRTDSMVDLILPTMIELCGHTKTLNRKNGDESVTAIVSNATCNARLLNYISAACHDKNVPPRVFAAGWLKTTMKQHGRQCEHTGGLDLIDKCIRTGLQDAKPEVREPMRGTYWVFARMWPDRAESIMSSLDSKAQKTLENDASNPANKALKSKVKPGKVDAPSKPTVAVSSRPSVKEAMLAQKRAMKAAEVQNAGEQHQARNNSTHTTSQPHDTELDNGSAFSRSPATHLSSQSHALEPNNSSAFSKSTISHTSSQSQATELNDSSAFSKSTSSAPPRSALKEAMLAKRRAIKSAQTTVTEAAPRPASAQSHNTDGLPRPASALSQSIEGPPRPPSAQSQTAEPHMTMLSSGPVRRPRPHLPQMSKTENILPVRPISRLRKADTLDVPPRIVDSVGRSTAANIAEKPTTLSGQFPEAGIFKKTTPALKRSQNIPPQILEPVALASATKTFEKTSKTPTEAEKPKDASVAAKTFDDLPAYPPQVAESTYLSSASDSLEVRALQPRPTRLAKASATTKKSEKEPVLPPQNLESGNSSTVSSISENAASSARTATRAISTSTVGSTETVIRRKIDNPQPLAFCLESPLRGLGKENETHTVSHTRRWHRKETAEKPRSISPRSKDPEEAKKMMARGIERITSRTIDDHGYRKLQGLIHYHDQIFEDEHKYDEMLLALLDALETPNTEKRVPLGRPFDNKFQILVTIRLMFLHNRKYFAAYFPRAMSAIVTARRNFESRNHIVSGLEETAQDIMTACDPPDVIDAVLDVLETEETDEAGCRTIAMGLHILSGLSARMRALSASLDSQQELRMAKFGRVCLREQNSVVRRAVIGYCLELRRMIRPEERFFRLVTGDVEDLKNLITYYVASSGS